MKFPNFFPTMSVLNCGKKIGKFHEMFAFEGKLGISVCREITHFCIEHRAIRLKKNKQTNKQTKTCLKACDKLEDQCGMHFFFLIISRSVKFEPVGTFVQCEILNLIYG